MNRFFPRTVPKQLVHGFFLSALAFRAPFVKAGSLVCLEVGLYNRRQSYP